MRGRQYSRRPVYLRPMPTGKDWYVRLCFAALVLSVAGESTCVWLGYDHEPGDSLVVLMICYAPVVFTVLYFIWWGSLRRSLLFLPVAGALAWYGIANTSLLSDTSRQVHQVWAAAAAATVLYAIHFLGKPTKRRADILKLAWFAVHFNGLALMHTSYASPLLPYGAKITALLYITLLDVRLDQRRQENERAQPHWDFEEEAAPAK